MCYDKKHVIIPFRPSGGGSTENSKQEESKTMSTIQTVLAVIMIIASLFLTFTILMQSGSRQGMSGTISGGAETFFGSGKAKGMDAVLNKLTIIVAIVFVVLAIALNVLQ